MTEKPIAPIIIKIMPWRGPNEDVIKGIKTKITLYDDRLEYRINYTQTVSISLTKDGNTTGEEMPSVHYTDEQGNIEKSALCGFIKYAETNYTLEGTAYMTNYLDLCYTGGLITISCQEKDEQEIAYEQLMKWKYNIK